MDNSNKADDYLLKALEAYGSLTETEMVQIEEWLRSKANELPAGWRDVVEHSSINPVSLPKLNELLLRLVNLIRTSLAIQISNKLTSSLLSICSTKVVNQTIDVGMFDDFVQAMAALKDTVFNLTQSTEQIVVIGGYELTHQFEGYPNLKVIESSDLRIRDRLYVFKTSGRFVGKYSAMNESLSFKETFLSHYPKICLPENYPAVKVDYDYEELTIFEFKR